MKTHERIVYYLSIAYVAGAIVWCFGMEMYSIFHGDGITAPLYGGRASLYVDYLRD